MEAEGVDGGGGCTVRGTDMGCQARGRARKGAEVCVVACEGVVQLQGEKKCKRGSAQGRECQSDHNPPWPPLSCRTQAPRKVAVRPWEGLG